MNNENSIEYNLGKILCNNKLTISTAESCTGGMVAAKLISYPQNQNHCKVKSH